MLGAPLTLGNFTLLGSVLGMGRGSVGLALQILLNGVNIVMSFWLGLWLDFGIAGVAWGTLTGEAVAFIAGLAYMLFAFRGTLRPKLSTVLSREKLKALFAINRDIMIRSLALVAAFTLQTRVGTLFGPELLAANALLMNFFLIASFFLDGMANAAEQITGRAIGARFRPGFERAIKLTAVWSFGLAAVCALFFLLLGGTLIDVMTTSEPVRALARDFLPWAALTALTGALAFQMDGVFIGATWSREMRNMMLLALAGYCAALALFASTLGNHGLWLALNIFLALRGLTLAAILPRKLAQDLCRQPLIEPAVAQVRDGVHLLPVHKG